jgi:hypothetical protein
MFDARKAGVRASPPAYGVVDFHLYAGKITFMWFL